MKQRIWRLTGFVLCSLFIGTYPVSHYASPNESTNEDGSFPVYGTFPTDGSFSTDGTQSGDAVPGDEDCYAEITSIDFGDSSEKLENIRFRHVFQYIDAYPYYRAVFIDVAKAGNWRIGYNTKLRAWSSRFLDSDGDWNEGIYSNKLFRTLYFINSQVTVAGVEREVNKICRLAWSPVVVTNSDKLVPAIEAELARRADRIHALRIVNNEVPVSRADWRSAFNSLRPDTFIHLLTVLRREHLQSETPEVQDAVEECRQG